MTTADYEASSVTGNYGNGRVDRPMRLSWSGIVSGTALGWGLFSLLSLIAASIGFAKFDPFSAQPENGLGAGSAIFGIVALLISSFVGAYLAVRVAGDRRRSEALLHGGVCWAFSMLLGAALALGAAHTAAQSAAMVASGPRAQAKAQRESNIRERNGGATAQDRQNAEEASEAAAKTTGATAAGAFLALIASLLGALVAASRSSGRSMGEELHPAKGRRDGAGMIAVERSPSSTHDARV